MLSYVLAGLAIAVIAWGLKLAFTPGPGLGLLNWLLMIVAAVCACVIIF